MLLFPELHLAVSIRTFFISGKISQILPVLIQTSPVFSYMYLFVTFLLTGVFPRHCKLLGLFLFFKLTFLIKLVLILLVNVNTHFHNIQNDKMCHITYCFIVISDHSLCLLVEYKFLGNNAEH